MKHFFYLQALLFTLIAVSCNAQTFKTPSPKTPSYENLLSLNESSFASLQYESPTSITTTTKKETPTPTPSIPKSNLLKVSTIAPTHYADTHNAFFCRMERKINKKFVMPVRIRLEGF
ncbi:MAG: hypothetical protein AB8B69_17600 [Chitinophagales bacterium]